MGWVEMGTEVIGLPLHLETAVEPSSLPPWCGMVEAGSVIPPLFYLVRLGSTWLKMARQALAYEHAYEHSWLPMPNISLLEAGPALGTVAG